MVKQENFFHGILHPLMEKAKNGKIILLFLDASHFVMGCDFLGHIYSKLRRYVKTFSGRKRYNVLGAMDYVTKKVLAVTNDSYITATDVCAMLQKISKAYVEKEVHIILDNARYQKCKTVTEMAKQLNIHLEYIPPYSPNLNLIERLWRFVKNELSSKYFNDFDVFRKKIDSIISSTDGVNKANIDSLMGKGVQLYHGLASLDDNSFVLDGKTA